MSASAVTTSRGSSSSSALFDIAESIGHMKLLPKPTEAEAS